MQGGLSQLLPAALCFWRCPGLCLGVEEPQWEKLGRAEGQREGPRQGKLRPGPAMRFIETSEAAQTTSSSPRSLDCPAWHRGTCGRAGQDWEDWEGQEGWVLLELLQ